MYEDQEQWKVRNKTFKFSCMFSLNCNKLKPFLIFFFDALNGVPDIPLNHENYPFYPFFGSRMAYRLKYEWPPRGSIMKNSTYKT